MWVTHHCSWTWCEHNMRGKVCKQRNLEILYVTQDFDMQINVRLSTSRKYCYQKTSWVRGNVDPRTFDANSIELGPMISPKKRLLNCVKGAYFVLCVWLFLIITQHICDDLTYLLRTATTDPLWIGLDHYCRNWGVNWIRDQGWLSI